MGKLYNIARVREGELPPNNSQVDLARLIDQTFATLHSPHTRRAYYHHLSKFASEGHSLTRQVVQAHLATFDSPSASRMALAAILRLTREAELTGQIDPTTARQIALIRLKPNQGIRQGNWLTLDNAKKLINLPDRSTRLGRRDAALFALVLGCGLRRSEAVSVTWSQYQIRDNRMALVDLRGKGGRIRTVPVPAWAQADLDRWAEDSGLVLSKGGAGGSHPPALRSQQLTDTQPILPLSATGLFWIVGRYAKSLGIALTPHDLRRTLAKLMRESSVELEQIQFTLGHARLETTERYLGGRLKLALGSAGVDRTGL